MLKSNWRRLTFPVWKQVNRRAFAEFWVKKWRNPENSFPIICKYEVFVYNFVRGNNVKPEFDFIGKLLIWIQCWIWQNLLSGILALKPLRAIRKPSYAMCWQARILLCWCLPAEGNRCVTSYRLFWWKVRRLSYRLWLLWWKIRWMQSGRCAEMTALPIIWIRLWTKGR